MKNLLLMTLAAVMAVMGANAHNAETMLEKPRVDKNVELLGIVFRLAGAKEYSSTSFKRYADSIEKHFGEYKDHELISFARSIRRDNGIGYDAVPTMAVHLDEGLNLRADVAVGSPGGKWKGVDLDMFVQLLKKFAADARFDEFYAANAWMYAEAGRRFMPVCEAVDQEWFARFFGTEAEEKFVIVNALVNGGHNYGCAVEYTDGLREIYSFMGAWNVDGEGMVVFPADNYLPTLIHEFCHAFVNPLIDRHKESFREAGEKFFALVGEQMRAMAYPMWEIMMYEALVRAAVIKYMYDHGAEKDALNARVQQEKRAGFGWVKPLFDELQKYDAARDEYPTLEDYMPRLAEAYKVWAEKLPQK